MTVLLFSFLLLLISILAGLLGSLTGLGGGVILIPALVLGFHINIHYAMGASLISVIATSTGSAAGYLRYGYTNLRIGMFLETIAVPCALIGAFLAAIISKTLIAVIFSLILFLSAFLTVMRKEEQEESKPSDVWALALKLPGNYPTHEGSKNYSVRGVPKAFSFMALAGCLSGLLGIGAGSLRVLVMDHAMGLPYKVSAATSNFMIGITAAASVGVYFANGYIDPGITYPVMIGVAFGAWVGGKLLVKFKTTNLRWLFSSVICLLGIEMLYNALKGSL